jgi:hypothetical protein
MKDKNKKIDGTLFKSSNDIKKLYRSNDFLTDIHWEDYIKITWEKNHLEYL